MKAFLRQKSFSKAMPLFFLVSALSYQSAEGNNRGLLREKANAPRKQQTDSVQTSIFKPDIDSLVEARENKDYYNLLYKRQRKDQTTASVEEIYSSDFSKTISSAFNGVLTGRISGLATSQTNGEPGSDAISLSLRGRSPLILLDGVPQNFTSINPEQIESVTVLKDAIAVAALGIRASNGAVLLTSKKGYNAPQEIKLTAFTGVSRATVNPKTLNAYQYGQLYNEALANDGFAPLYSTDALNAFRDGTDPVKYPNINWQDEIMKNSSVYNRYDLQIRGGKQTAKYYMNLDYLDQPGNFRADKNLSYNTNSGYKRYIVRSNVDIDLSKYITTSLNLVGRIQEGTESGATTSTLYRNIIGTPAGAFPIYNSDGSFATTNDFRYNVYQQNFGSGYRRNSTRDFRIDLAIKGDLSPITKGLWVKASATINSYLVQSINRTNVRPLFNQYVSPQGDTTYTRVIDLADQTNSISTNAQNRVFYTEAVLGYNRSFGKNHYNAQLLVNNDFRHINGDLPYNIRGISGLLSYNYDSRYLLDAGFAYNGSKERYPSNKAFGFFPSLGLGWNVTNEDFFNKDGIISSLLVKSSYGLTGDFTAGYYDYFQYFDDRSPGYNFGNSPTGFPGVFQSSVGNTNLTWEKARKFNFGVNVGIKKNLTVNAEYFNNLYYDILQEIGRNTNITGISYNQQNIGENRYSGFDFGLNYQNSVGAVKYHISPNISLVKTKVVYQDEAFRAFPYQRRTGMPVGQMFGYIAEGLYQSVEEINNSAKTSEYGIVPGDIKYRDLNNDGVIDENDQTAIGTTKPAINYGIVLGANYKGLEFTAVINGAANRDVYLSGWSMWGFQGNQGQLFEHHLDRWTPATSNTATFPRLTAGNNRNNEFASSYWVRSGDFLRLRTVEIAYNLPQSLTHQIKLSGVRIFVNGSNLVTFTGLKDRDPENLFYLYPIQKMINAGLNVKF